MKSSKRPLNIMMNAALRLMQGRDMQAAARAMQHAVRGAVRASTQHAAKAVRQQGDVIDVIVRERPAPSRARGANRFDTDRQRAEGLGRDYKLFVPAGLDDSPRPLLVMLHGCTQDPDDFAAGTGMNELARKHGFLVLYPEQSKGANSSRCWNWFKHNHQARGAGEPAVIAGMVKTVLSKHAVDTSRVYVAGLSAGGAMAAILGDAYPDVFAAVGVHSGLATGAASDAGTAFSAMKSGASGGGIVSVLNPNRVTPPPVREHPAPPTIVFHGDADATVSPVNGDQVLAASLGDIAAAVPPSQTESGQQGGRGFTRKTWRDAEGRTRAEQWLVHGAGHAWSGGNAAGSYADPKGPDASREMLRFFLEHPLKPAV